MHMTKQRIRWGLAILWGLAIASYAWVGTFSRIISDDYCTAVQGLNYGAVGSALYNFENWAGRVTAFFVLGAIAPLQPFFHQIQTLVLIVVLAVSAYGLMRFFVPSVSRRDAGLASVFFVFLCLYSVPQPRNLYWLATLVLYGYTIGLVVLQTLIAFSVIRWQGSKRLLLGGVLAFLVIVSWVIATSSETIAVALFPIHLLGSLWLAWRIPHRRILILMLGASLLFGATVGLLTSLSAPGNAIRQEAIVRHNGHTSPDVITLVQITLSITGQYLSQPDGLASILLAGLGAFVLFHWMPVSIKNFPKGRLLVLDTFFLAGLTLLAIMATVTANAYGAGVASYHIFFFPRVLQLLLGVWVGVQGAIMLAHAGFPSAYLRRRWTYQLTQGAVVGMLFLVPMLTIGHNVVLGQKASHYAQEWDWRDAYLREQAQQGNTSQVSVPAYSFSLAEYMILEETSARPEGGERAFGCVSRYYGIAEIIIEPRQ